MILGGINVFYFLGGLRGSKWHTGLRFRDDFCGAKSTITMKSLILATLFTVGTATNNHTAIDTNVCGVNWYYCPRDPGCKTYTMSVHDMEVHANDYVRHNLTTPLRTTPLFIFNFKYFQKKNLTL